MDNLTPRGSMGIERIAVLGAGQMGNGIAQVAACAGYEVVMIDIKQDYLDNGLAAIENSLSRVVKKERMTQQDADATLARIKTSTDRNDCSDVDDDLLSNSVFCDVFILSIIIFMGPSPVNKVTIKIL